MLVGPGTPQRRVRRHRDVEFLAEGPQVRLLEVRVQLDLQHRRLDLSRIVDPLDLLAVEVGESDRPGQAALDLLLHGLKPSVNISQVRR
jgi:hypothetical protein